MPTSPTRQSLFRCTVGAALVALLAGCTAGASPRTTTPPALLSSAPAPTVTPSPPAAPTLPAPMPSPTPPPEMSRDDEAGAIAAATYFLTELYQYSVTTQNAAPLAGISHPDCRFCASVETAIAAERTAGQVTHPGESAVISATAVQINPLTYDVALSLDQAADVLWSADGRLISTNSPRSVELAVVVIWRGNGWVLRGVDALSIDGVKQ